MDAKRIVFMNTCIDSLTAAEAKKAVDAFVQEGGIHYVVSPNSDIVVKMQNDGLLKRICEEADLILTDGQILAKLSKLLNNPIKERVCMTDFIWDVCDLAYERGYKIFLFGGKEEVLVQAEKRISEKYSGSIIADYYSPPFGFENNERQLEAINKRIRKSGADILIVFLGCPKQEKFIYFNKDSYRIPVSITMGGCVDFIAGRVRRAPLWMQRMGLEWFYRFLQEPRRLFKRYFIDDIKIFGLAVKYKLIKTANFIGRGS